MTNTLKMIKIFVVLILCLIILAGGFLFLLKLNVFPAPEFVTALPVIGNSQAEKGDQPTSETEKLATENSKLSKSLKARSQEADELKKTVAELEKKLKVNQEEEESLKQEIASLNDQIIDLKTARENREAVYKDMAEYFVAMKGSDAADILSRLEEEDIVGIISAMDSEAAAEILKNMDHDKAAAITRKMLVVGD